MKRRILGRSLATIALLVATLLMARAGVQAAANDATKQDNPEISKLLEDIKSQAFDLKRDSEELEMYTQVDASWQSHAEQLNQMKDRINTIGKTISKLQALRSSASPWQQEAIDRIIPVAQKLASNTTAAIEHLNKNQLRVKTPQYQEYVKSNAEAAANLAALVKDFVEYGKSRTTLEAYERKLEVPN
jgi:cytochrome c-type biogenesis protein CcmH/NrfF